MNTTNRYMPDYAIHPGEILEETLQARGILKSDFARRCGISAKTVSQIISGNAPVLPDVALHFERVLGVSSTIWNNLNAQYELYQAQLAESALLAEKKCWVKQFPVSAMVKKGWVCKCKDVGEQAGELLNFLGVASVNVWEEDFGSMQVAYRKSNSFESKPHAVAAWLRRGEIDAGMCYTAPYSEEVFKASLLGIRKMSVLPPKEFGPKIKKLCSDAGVALVLVGELPGIHLSGAARWLNPQKALIQLSLRHKSNDHFWFSFFHEAAHILKHAKKQVYLDDVKSGNTDLEEEANTFARNFLIPSKAYREFCKSRLFTAATVRSCARRLGIAPGIVVGRLQHDKLIPFGYLYELKKKFELVDSRQETGV